MSKSFGVNVAYVLVLAALAAAPLRGDAAPRYGQQLVVAKSGGDFTNPATALRSITDASEAKPYLVKVMPGVYDVGNVQMTVPPFVTFEGSGRAATTIVSTFVDTSGSGMPVGFLEVVGAANVRGLTLVGSPGNFGVTVRGATTRFEDVAIRTTGEYAIYVWDGSTFAAHGLELVTTGNGAVLSTALGLYVQYSTATVDDATIKVSNAYFLYGVNSAADSTITLTNTTVEAAGPISQGYALQGYSPASLVFRNGIVRGSGSVIGLMGAGTVSSSVVDTPYAASSSYGTGPAVFLYSQIAGGFYVPTRLIGCYDMDLNVLPNQ